MLKTKIEIPAPQEMRDWDVKKNRKYDRMFEKGIENVLSGNHKEPKIVESLKQ